MASEGSTTRRPGVDAADGLGELARGGVLDDEAGGARLERPAQVAGPAERRHHEGAHAGQGAAHGRRCRDAVDARHLDVEQAHVGAGGPGRVDDLVAPAHLRDHLEIGLEREQRRERPTHEGLVVGEQHLDRLAHSVTSSTVP